MSYDAEKIDSIVRMDSFGSDVSSKSICIKYIVVRSYKTTQNDIFFSSRVHGGYFKRLKDAQS